MKISYDAMDTCFSGPAFDATSNTYKAFINRALHWEISSLSKYGGNCIGAIDVATEKLRFFEEPHTNIETSDAKLAKDVILGTLGDYLCMVDDRIDGQFFIWVMKEYGVAESWTKQYIIRKETLGPLRRVSFKMLRIMNYGSVFLHGREDQCHYDLEKGKCKHIRVEGIPSRPHQLEVVVHMGSLVSPKKD
ncbi:hypothetical protein IFM89_028055 [Coptis chinensis]|uniref:F-box associated domain-containing protein n=1 Tax=Coptis chinensis TaxID=261450 RepID=A0A835LK27_9MAGN|nr:hypothetical protein IFM89_028055 [Coptis chinensis]